MLLAFLSVAKKFYSSAIHLKMAGRNGKKAGQYGLPDR